MILTFLVVYHLLCVAALHKCYDDILDYSRIHTCDNEEYDYNSNNQFELVTYQTSSISTYSSYSTAINSMYSTHRGYDYLSTSPLSGFEFDSNDQRWNKVRILETLLYRSSAFNTSRYLVWIDADLIFLDFSFMLESIVQQYTGADIIISAETLPENGLVNTGCMIVRKTEWSLRFLSTWWSTVDRATGMDQHVFDLLWRDNALSMQSHVAIIPSDVLNSKFPLTKYHTEENKVIHLAGASAAVRRYVLKHAYDSLCCAINVANSANMSLLVPSQLGITPAFLKSIDYLSLQREELSNIWDDLTKLKPVFQILTLKEFMKTSSQILGRVRDASQTGYLESTVKTTSAAEVLIDRSITPTTVLRILLWVHSQQYNYYVNNKISLSNADRITLIQSTLDSGFNLLVTAKMETRDGGDGNGDGSKSRSSSSTVSLSLSGDEVEEILHHLDVFSADIVDSMLAVASRDNMRNSSQRDYPRHSQLLIGQAMYYRFKYYEFKSHYLTSLNTVATTSISTTLDVVHTLESAYCVWHTMTSVYQWYGAGRGVANPYGEGVEILSLLSERHYALATYYAANTDDTVVSSVNVGGLVKQQAQNSHNPAVDSSGDNNTYDHQTRSNYHRRQAINASVLCIELLLHNMHMSNDIVNYVSIDTTLSFDDVYKLKPSPSDPDIGYYDVETVYMLVYRLKTTAQLAYAVHNTMLTLNCIAIAKLFLLQVNNTLSDGDSVSMHTGTALLSSLEQLQKQVTAAVADDDDDLKSRNSSSDSDGQKTSKMASKQRRMRRKRVETAYTLPCIIAYICEFV